MTVNLHTHTYHCGHATGTPEEYVKRAIENGVKVMGFSEHVPFKFPGDVQNPAHLKTEDVGKYFAELNALREKYKEQIKIIIGFEMEYFPKYFEEMFAFAKKVGAEYLLLAQHRVGEEEPYGHWIGHIERPLKDLVNYVDMLIDGIKTGVFTYICHPDVINATSDMEVYTAQMTRLCRAAKEYDIPLEINFYGIRDNRFYPFDKFWEIAGKVGCKVVFGFDAHDTLAAFDQDSIPVAKQIVEKYNLTLIENPKPVKLNLR